VDFFGAELAHRLAEEGGPADLILANNVLAHAPDINDFIAGLRILLKAGGRIVLESPYGVELVEKNEFDTIYHEHVFYFTLTPLVPLFRRHGLAVFHIERIRSTAVRSGCCRSRRAQPEQMSAAELLSEEHRKESVRCAFTGRPKVRRLDRPAPSCCRNSSRARCPSPLTAPLPGQRFELCGLGRDALILWPTAVPQTRTPLRAHANCRGGRLAERRPDHTLLLTWNFADEILAQRRPTERAANSSFRSPGRDRVIEHEISTTTLPGMADQCEPRERTRVSGAHLLVKGVRGTV
jgi:hypothetical protein